MAQSTPTASDRKTWVITGPTAGIGRRTALQLAKHGTVVLVGRNRGKLDEVEKEVRAQDGHAVSVVCDLSDITSARRAAAEIAALSVTRFCPWRSRSRSRVTPACLGAARGLPRRARESRPRPPRQHRATRRGEQHRLPARAGRAVQQ